MAQDPVPLSALQHYSYCPRQYALIHLEQVFEENAYTLRGQAVHQRVDQPGEEMRPSGVRVVRSLHLYHDTLGLIGKADTVEFLPDGTPYPVEYKHGPRRQRIHDEIQLAAQALCLEYMTGLPVPEGAIFHASSKKRRKVLITEALRLRVLDAIAGIRRIEAEARLPPPVNDKRCDACSLRDACQPAVFAASQRLDALSRQLYTPMD